MKIDTDDLLNATEVAELLGLSHRTAIATYRARYYFPEPIFTKGTCVLWARRDVERWAAGPRTRRATG